MKRFIALAILSFFLAAAGAGEKRAVSYAHTEDVIYGRKFGTALTLDVFRPEKQNGAAILFLVSGGWSSSHGGVRASNYTPFLERGYTVFAVVHGSQPRFIVPEIFEDVQRAARFIRHNAATYGVDPQRFGVTGTSSGGHLSLMLALRGGPGQPDAKDPVDRESSAVQAVACFCPPTDFSNWAFAGDDQWLAGPVDPSYKGAWGTFADTREGRVTMSQAWSPIRFVNAAMPPILVLHGEADKTVPFYQAKIFQAAAQAVGATYKLVSRPGRDHSWPEMSQDRELLADWFDRFLAPKK